MGSRSGVGRVALFAIATLLLLGGVRAADAGTPGLHEDERLGYRIRYPKEWTYVAMGPEEKWIVGKYLSNRSYAWTDPTDGMTASHKPQMTMFGFLVDAPKKPEVELEAYAVDAARMRLEPLGDRVRVSRGGRRLEVELLRATYHEDLE